MAPLSFNRDRRRIYLIASQTSTFPFHAASHRTSPRVMWSFPHATCRVLGGPTRRRVACLRRRVSGVHFVTNGLPYVRGLTSTGISIVSLRNEGFPGRYYGGATTGRHLGCTETLRNSPSRRMFANSSWGNAATAFSLWSQFHVCYRMCYKQ